MKKVLTLIAFSLLAGLALTAQTAHLTFNQDAEFASISQSTGPNSSFSLSVSRNSTTTSGAAASLTYFAFSFPDPDTLNFVEIVGNIPASAFTGQNTQNLVLDFDTSQLDPTTSFSESCTFDLTTTSLTCGPAPQGVINLSFTENGLNRSRTLALGQEITFGPVTTRIHQRSDNSSASVQGTIFGTPLSSGGATVGINHNSTLEFIRN